MTIFIGQLPYGPGTIVAYADNNTDYFRSSTRVAEAKIDNNGLYRLRLGAGTFRVRVSTVQAAYEDITVTSSNGLEASTLTLGTPKLRSTPTVRPTTPTGGTGSGTSQPPPREQVTVTSSHAHVRPYLPAARITNGSGTRSSFLMYTNTNASFPRIIEWYFNGGLKTIRIQNNTTADTLNIGYGSDSNVNPAGSYTAVAAGKEWVGDFGTTTSILGRFTTAQDFARVIVERAD